MLSRGRIQFRHLSQLRGGSGPGSRVFDHGQMGWTYQRRDLIGVGALWLGPWSVDPAEML